MSSLEQQFTANGTDNYVPYNSARSTNVDNRQQLLTLSSYYTKPITKIYSINDQILAAFDSCLEKKIYRGAYVFGWQFLEGALLELPKHGYFYAPKHRSERLVNAREACRVVEQLNDLLKNELLDETGPKDWERLEKFRLLVQEELNMEEFIQDKTHDWQHVSRFEPVSKPSPMKLNSMFCWDILEYTQMLCPSSHHTVDSSEKKYVSSSHLNISSTEANKSITLEELYDSTAEERDDYVIIEKSPSKNNTRSFDELERALHISGVFPSNSPHTSHFPMTTATSCQKESSDGHQRPRRCSNAIDFESLKQCYLEDFEDLRSRGLIHIKQTNTYQGRLPGSINGCTVIAPLLCLHHLLNTEDQNLIGYSLDYGLPDETVDHVIDVEATVLLPEVRKKLGLTEHALIIPQDVHDYLIEKEWLSCEQFMTVVGGNILDEKHLAELIKQLTSSKESKLAATFFFHEHVVTLLRLKQGNDTWFDLIDSLPNSSMLSTFKAQQSLSEIEVTNGPINSCRVRCQNVEALKATILWFACSHFTDDNKCYINMYDWDDAFQDFDPRVFQAFLWTSSC
jgi:hypothetical protein